MAQSGFDAAFLRAWQNEDCETIDDVVNVLNADTPEGERPEWDKATAQKTAARYRKAGVNLRKFTRPRSKVVVDTEAANAFLASLAGEKEEEDS